MIARKTWREVRMMTFAYTAIIELLLIPAIFLFDEVRGMSGALEKLMPMQVLKDVVRSIGHADPDYAYRQYMAIQLFFKGINIVGIAGAVLLGTALIARERENRTLELLLARPVGRTRILLAKFGVVACALVIPIFLTSWSAVWLSPYADYELPFWPVTVCSAHASAFVLMFAAFTTLCSVICQTQAHTAFVVGFVIVMQASLYFVQEIRVSSLFRLSDPYIYTPIMEANYSMWTAFKTFTVWPTLATAAFLTIAVLIFRRSEP